MKKKKKENFLVRMKNVCVGENVKNAVNNDEKGINRWGKILLIFFCLHGYKLQPLLPLSLCVCLLFDLFLTTVILFHSRRQRRRRRDEEEVYVSYFYIFIYRIKSDKNGSEKVLTMSKNIGINNFLILGKRKGKNSTIITIKKAVTNEIKSLTRRVCVCGCLKKTSSYLQNTIHFAAAC